MADEVLLETRGNVLVITLNRPAAKNAIDGALAAGVVAAVEAFDADDDLAVGVLTGAGGGFCAGMDLKAFVREGAPAGLGRFLRHGSAKPLVAAIEGFALAGGLEVALTCDLLVAARGAKLGIPEARVGLFAAGGALLRLPRRVPYGLATELALTGEPLDAERAHQVGLVDRLVEPGAALDEAIALAERIAASAPLSVATSKQLLREAQGMSEAEFWEAQKAHTALVFGSDDAREGARAFAERRPPRWSRQ